MATTDNSIRIPLRVVSRPSWAPDRPAEPVSIGVPLPPQAAFEPAGFALEWPDKSVVPVQARPLDRWPDGSIRWMLIDFQAPAGAATAEPSLLVSHRNGRPDQAALSIGRRDRGLSVRTAGITFEIFEGGAFPIAAVERDGVPLIDPDGSRFRIRLEDDDVEFSVGAVQVYDEGPLRAEIEVQAVARRPTRAPLVVSARVEFFAGIAAARMAITVRNSRRARHPGGQWVLGDAGSVFLESASLFVTAADPIEQVECAAEAGEALSRLDVPFEVYQESSGGDNWNGPAHRNRHGDVPLRVRGYRLRSGATERSGHRATPVVVARTAGGSIAATMPHFWENFPRAISVDERRIEVGCFPRQAPDLHELQGGEQKTHVVVLAFDGAGAGAEPHAAAAWGAVPLAWCHDPLLLYPDPEWCCGTGAVPFLTPAAGEMAGEHQKLVRSALDPVNGFAAKNERADEFGWRHFGDLHADHESAFQPPDRPFVSHYNNQYDAIAGFALQFLRTGDARWWRLMADLSRHVRDIDIYHTDEDKAAYSGGLFWHTQHYTDAGTSTHRTYPRGTAGGGPSAEHNYNAGLMLHYFMTGERASSDAAIGLGRWVIGMDDGRRTPFRWLASGPTGLASATGSMAYHGPGRGSANSILACLVAHRLTGERSFADKADELVRRCIHPDDDVDARGLFDVERRWYYTVFLQALGVYLHDRAERGQIDAMFGYAQASLLRYARWMAGHERPYLKRPEVLEFPTETWAAQDMRKAEVFWWAALHAHGAERRAFLDKADFFYRYSTSTLSEMPTSRFTRPTVLMLQNGWRRAWFLNRDELPAAPAGASGERPPAPVPFQPQKAVALRRAKAAAALAALAVALGLGLLAWNT